MDTSEDLQCRVCGGHSSVLWQGCLLDLKVTYMKCEHCGYVQTERPYWLDRAYARSINESDTGIMSRNLSNARIVLSTLFAVGGLHQRVVDLAGGYGILTRLLRDSGVDAFWADAYCQNLVARGFEHHGESAALVTAFEVFEHFVDPLTELHRMLAIAPNVLLSTEIIPDLVPAPGQWWYYGEDHGQHIGFYQVKTLRFLAERCGKRLLSDGHSYHLMTDLPLRGGVWNIYLKLKGFVSLCATRQLRSKTASDYLQVADNLRKAQMAESSSKPTN